MFVLRIAVLLTAVTAMLARPANAQTTVTVDVGFNNGGTLAFRDQASGSTSSAGNPAITRIHEGDTVQFVWQGTPPHNVNPYDPNNHLAQYQASFPSATITTAST